jgi:hypothetical protein
MNTLPIRVILALCLATGFLASNPMGSSANTGPWNVFFPWVPNGAMLGSMGPFYGAIVIQNLEAQPISINMGTMSAPNYTLVTREIVPHGSITMTAAELGVPEPGSGVFVYTTTTVNNNPARFAGVQKQTTAVPPHTTQFLARTSGAHQVVDGYAGLTGPDIDDNKFVLPIVQSNSGWNTVIRVASNLADGLTGDVTVALHPAGGGDTISITRRMKDGETTTFDLQDLNVGEGFVGSAVITSSALSILVLAERYKESTNMLITNVAKRAGHCNETHYAPLVFENHNSWNTGISVANLSNTANAVKITYFAMNGAVADEATLTIPPNGQDFRYTPSSGIGSSFVGAAIIEGAAPLCAAVDEVKYTGDQPDVGHSMGYLSTGTTAYSSQSLMLPLAQRGTFSTGLGDTSGIQLFNVRDQNAVVEVHFVDQSGNFVRTVQTNMAGRTSATVYVMAIDLPDGFQGSAIIDVISGTGWVTGISNNVNYQVQFDGSAAYSLVLRP